MFPHSLKTHIFRLIGDIIGVCALQWYGDLSRVISMCFEVPAWFRTGKMMDGLMLYPPE